MATKRHNYTEAKDYWLPMQEIGVLARYNILHNKQSVSGIFRPGRLETSCYNL